MFQSALFPMILTVRLAFRQLRASRAFALSMIVNMALGLTGYLVVDGFNRSFLRELNSRTRAIASADLTISARQALTPSQEAIIQNAIPADSVTISREISLMSMASAGSGARLVETRFVDEHFPLYPGIQLQDGGALKESAARAMAPGTVWIYRELREQLNARPGDTIKIGEYDFKIADIIVDDPTVGTGGFTFAPRIFAKIEDLPKTKLLGLGSRNLHIQRLKFKQPTDEEPLAAKIQSEMSRQYATQDIRVKTHRAVTSELSRVQSYMNDYLSLIALVALFLSAVGTSYIIRGHLNHTIKEFAIMSSLGCPPWVAPGVFIAQCLILGVGATLIATIFASLAMPVLSSALIPITGTFQSISIPPLSIIQTSAFAIASGLLLAAPILLRLSNLSPGFLFSESANATSVRSYRQNLALVPAIILWWLTAVYESKSWTNGSIFAAACVSLAALLSLIALPLTRISSLAARLPKLRWQIALALRLMSRNRAATISTFLALALGTTLINLIPHLKRNITREISRPDSTIPQLFMFDIQDDQVDSVKGFLDANNARVGTFYPMVRARLEAINGETVDGRKMEFEGEREQQQREALQARTQNLSYRLKLSAAEEVTRGAFTSAPFSGSGLPALSIEEGFAKRLNIKLTDRMTFDVMGVSVEGQVTSLRKVRWTSFEPNFMILFQPGVLDEAPKIWVTSASEIPPGKINQLQSSLVKLHSNISVVDIKASVSRMLTFIDQTSTAINVVAWLALIGGAGVLYAVAYAGSSRRSKSMAILKALGATPGDAQATILLEYAMIAGAAIIFGIGLGSLVSAGVTIFILKSPWSISDLWFGVNGLAIFPVCLLLSWIATRASARSNVVTLLSSTSST